MVCTMYAYFCRCYSKKIDSIKSCSQIDTYWQLLTIILNYSEIDKNVSKMMSLNEKRRV